MGTATPLVTTPLSALRALSRLMVGAKSRVTDPEGWRRHELERRALRESEKQETRSTTSSRAAERGTARVVRLPNVEPKRAGRRSSSNNYDDEPAAAARPRRRRSRDSSDSRGREKEADVTRSSGSSRDCLTPRPGSGGGKRLFHRRQKACEDERRKPIIKVVSPPRTIWAGFESEEEDARRRGIGRSKEAPTVRREDGSSRRGGGKSTPSITVRTSNTAGSRQQQHGKNYFGDDDETSSTTTTTTTSRKVERRRRALVANNTTTPPPKPASARILMTSSAPSDSANKRAVVNVRAKKVCDKCDSGQHETGECPNFRKQRERHPDATRRRSQPQLGQDDSKPVVARRARVVPQPPDGSCLFHSLCYGLRDGRGAAALRREIANFIRANPELRISDTPLKDWIKWDAMLSVASYASKMSSGGSWGGGIEMAATSELKNVSVEVYEPCAAGFRRISLFHKAGADKVVRVCYKGGVHYDALVI